MATDEAGAAGFDASVFRSVFDAYPDAVLLVDAGGRIVLANPAAAALLGFEGDALLGMNVDALVPSAVTARHAGLRQGYAHAPRARPMGNDLELSARRADGSEVMVEIALSPLHVAGAPHVVAALRGIGSYPRVQRAMRQARYNDYIAQAGRAAVDLGEPRAMIERGTLLAAHALEVEALGVWLLQPGRLEFRAASSVVQANHAQVRGAAQALVEQLLPNRPDTLLGYVASQAQTIVISSFARENRFAVRPELRDSAMQSALAVPMLRAGSVIGVVLAGSVRPGRFDDDERHFVESVANLFVTSVQRAETEAQLAHAQRLETVGQLTGGIAHDFNNLLTVIQGNLQMLADHPAVTGDGLLTQMVGAAARAGQRGAELTGKLLAFSRRQRLAAGPVDAGALLHALAGMLQRTLGARIHVHVHVESACPPCLADPSQLESALLNIAVNSRDAMPDGGELSFGCARCHTLPPQLRLPAAASGAAGDATGGAGWVAITIRDTGTGMGPDVLDRAFEPFFTTKEAGKGTGLGLSTVYGFVKQSGGHVMVDSALTKGTTITLFLPVAKAPGAVLPAAAAAAPPPGTRVLLVEDDAGVRAVALAFLDYLGCDVMVCADADAALDELRRDPDVDLLFSDITLGAGIDGIELARRARALVPGLRVLLTSGYSRYLAAGSPDRPREWPLLQKPYSRDQLAAAAAEALGGATAGSARSGRAPPE